MAPLTSRIGRGKPEDVTTDRKGAGGAKKDRSKGLKEDGLPQFAAKERL